MSRAPRRLAPLPHFLFEPRRAWLAIPAGAALSLTGALLLGNLVAHLFPAMEGPDFGISGLEFVLKVAVMAPLIETAIMAAVLEVLRRFLPPWGAIAASSAGWALAHSSVAPAWGLVIWWPFLIFSTLYVVWRERSFPAAFAVAASVHGLQNAIPAIGIALS